MISNSPIYEATRFWEGYEKVDPLKGKTHLYLMGDFFNETLFKIGISNQPKRRAFEVNESALENKYSHRFDIIESVEMKFRLDAANLEASFHSAFKDKRKYPGLPIFSGSTEIFILSRLEVQDLKRVFNNIRYRR